jgi:hypothetical protein
VQQSSRAYVAKTGFEPPPLKPQEKRLTGELDKVGQPRHRREYAPDRSFPAVREAVPVLTKLQGGSPCRVPTWAGSKRRAANWGRKPSGSRAATCRPSGRCAN